MYMVFSYMTWVEMDAILETFSIDKMSGRIRGIYLLFTNIGYIIGPLMATQLLDRYGFSSVFLFTMIVSSVLFIVTTIKLRNVKEEMREILGPKELLKKAFSNKDVFNIYLVSVTLEIFFALAIVYIPLYLKSIGFDWSQIGVLIVFGMVPYILFQYPAGLLADKKFGEKELIFAAIILTSVSTISIYFVESRSFLFWVIFMMIFRIGSALLEILRDSYFYKKVDGRDLDMIDFFRTAGPVGIVFGTFLSSFLISDLTGFPMKIIFLFSGVIMLLGLIPAMRIIDNISEEEERIGNGEIKFRTRLGFLVVLGKRLDIRRIRGIVR
jgi:MFS family permease